MRRVKEIPGAEREIREDMKKPKVVPVLVGALGIPELVKWL